MAIEWEFVTQHVEQPRLWAVLLRLALKLTQARLPARISMQPFPLQDLRTRTNSWWEAPHNI
jgi:hypothetical protein